jgi:hypothetical protein
MRFHPDTRKLGQPGVPISLRINLNNKSPYLTRAF